MAVLIVSDPGDIHASVIAWALDEYGTEATKWHPAPQLVHAGSIRFDPASVYYRFAAEGGEIAPSAIEAVWMHRWPGPAFPASFRECDKTESRMELAAYHEGLLELLPPWILWANPLAHRRSANFRLKQLAAAVAAELAIPPTIATDDSVQARKFIASHPEGEVVCTPLRVARERPGTSVHQSGATIVTPSDFDDPEALTWSPVILRKLVPKACGLRVAMFGRTCVSAKIFDDGPVARDDGPVLNVVPYDLPESLERKLHALMEKLGLVMGTIDLVVTPEGDHVFLEVDEQGQFLWLEERCPVLPLVDIAARFLACGDPYFSVDVVAGFGLKYANFPRLGPDQVKKGENGYFPARETRYGAAPN